jgi:adenylate/nucleoside-diphosphate kinase
VLAQLAKGSAVEEEDVLDLINNEFEKEVTHSRGFILDLPFEYNKYWIETLISNRVNLPKIECRYFTHVLQTDQTEEQWKYFTTSLMEKP